MVTVRCSTVLDAPVDAVWRVLRDFNSHARWHPAVVESAIEANKYPDQVGAVRRFRLSSGATLREQLLKLSDHERSLTYCILESPIPLIGYVATVTLRPVTDGGRTFWDWRSSFRAPPGQETSLAQMLAHDIYEAGFEGLRAMLGSGAAPRRGPAPVSGSASIAGQAIVLQRHGGPDELRPQRIEAPPPGPGEVRLRQTAIGLNYIDIYVRTGLYPLLTPPGVPGMEAAGTVVDVGPGVVELMPGDHVAYACPPVGAYAEIRTMKADQLVMLPPDIDDAVAAAVMLKGMTAEYLLRRTHRVKRGDTILIHAAAGGVGLLLCQWARHIGATVVGTVGTEIKARLAREAGCAFPVVYTQQDFVEAVREITKGRGVDVVYDGIGQATFLKSLEALATCGHLVSYGQSSGPIAPLDPGLLSSKSATLSRPVLFHYTQDPKDLREISGNLFAMIRRGVLQVPVHQRYRLFEAAQAHRDLEQRRTSGATILLP